MSAATNYDQSTNSGMVEYFQGVQHLEGNCHSQSEQKAQIPTAVNESIGIGEDQKCHPQGKTETIAATTDSISNPGAGQMFSSMPPPGTPLFPAWLDQHQNAGHHSHFPTFSSSALMPPSTSSTFEFPSSSSFDYGQMAIATYPPPAAVHHDSSIPIDQNHHQLFSVYDSLAALAGQIGGGGHSTAMGGNAAFWPMAGDFYGTPQWHQQWATSMASYGSGGDPMTATGQYHFEYNAGYGNYGQQIMAIGPTAADWPQQTNVAAAEMMAVAAAAAVGGQQTSSNGGGVKRQQHLGGNARKGPSKFQCFLLKYGWGKAINYIWNNAQIFEDYKMNKNGINLNLFYYN
jgi:hypothetical protein